MGDYSLIEIHNLSAQETTSHVMPDKLEFEETLTRNYDLLLVFSFQT